MGDAYPMNIRHAGFSTRTISQSSPYPCDENNVLLVELVNPTPDTLQPAPFTLHPTPCTLHPAPYTLYPYPTPYTPTLPFTPNPKPCTLKP